MASSSSASPPLLARRRHQRQEPAMAASSQRRCRGRTEKQGIMQRWAETMSLCCGVDCGWCVLQLWHKVVLRKWLNVGSGSGDSDFSADECGTSDGGDMDQKPYGEERRLGGLGAGTIGDEIKSMPYRLRRRKSETLRAHYIDTRELRICVGTWNVGGKFPPSDLNIQEWLNKEEQADIYVFGFQEVVPLNAGNIFGAEDNRPIAVWEQIIRENLDKICPNKPQYKCHSDPPSPSRFNPSDYVIVMKDELLSESDSDNYGELHPLIQQNADKVINCTGVHDKTYENFSSASNERFHKGKDLGRMDSVKTSDQPHKLSYGKVRSSNLEETTNQRTLTKLLCHSERLGIICPEQPLDMMAQHLQASTSLKDLATPVSLKSTQKNFNYFSNDDLSPEVNRDDGLIRSKRPYFLRIVSKQMVGVYLSVWVRRDLRKHIQNLSVSTVGVGAMGYMGNKGSISVSMSIHQTHFCFVCCHLTSGEKDGDELKRNADVEEILRRTVFNPLPGLSMPKAILDHERIIWLGDLNYRINLSYERTHEFISKQDWDGLFEKDQLKRELSKGRTFDGWTEGVVSFPPTYKYEFNSENYVSDEPKSGRRTPAWCDRILSRGKGIRLISYRRGELKLSDHRPVTAVYTADVEVLCHRKLQKALTFTDAEVEYHLVTEEERT
ncbi:type I inositol polyphosphate 5-phosphatase 1-like isoform X1 [Oryza brachyantha]|uniref:type I inositol polyphosphate 5-phosphatase 1-like isoform X1 n=1 Tax=Oryza brachyantha TaxID=4533 RepID=UPI00077689F9|nr:type I inositol polyphosphate 5-phosphatase 1-like isoform X1 [Oryza brachyantha]